MSQISKLLRHAADTSLISGDSIKPSVITRPIVNHNSPSPSANISSATTNIRTQRTTMADDVEKNGKKPTAHGAGTPKPVTLRKKPSWIDFENCKTDNLFRQTLASPEHKEIFEGSMIPLPSPDDGAKRGQIYSPTRMDQRASSTSDQSSASQESTTPHRSRESVISETGKEEKDAELDETEYGLLSELGTRFKSRQKKSHSSRLENDAIGRLPKKDIQQWIRNEANAQLVLRMPLGELEEKLRDGVLESEMDEHSGKWIRAYGLSEDE